MKLLHIVRTCARTCLLVGVVSLLNGGVVYAQSKDRAAVEASQQRDQAEQYLTNGQLDRAELAAMRAVELDKSSLTERARRVLVEVYLQRGELADAEQNIRGVRDVPNLPLPALEWTVRALMRVEIERVEGSGDAAGAQSRLDVFPTDGLSTAEAEWASRLRARVALRGFEQRRDAQAGREALATALAEARAANDTQAARWLVAAERRLRVVELEWAGTTDAARAAASELAALEEIRQPDLLWAQLVLARLDVRLAYTSGDRAQARALAEALAARPDASALDQSWAQGFLLRLDYEAAVAAKADNAPALAAQLGPFWALEPPSERPPPPMVVTHRASAQVGLVAGVQRWQHNLTAKTARNVELDCSATPVDEGGDGDACSSLTLGVAARGSYAFTEHLVVGGGLSITQPLLSGGLAGELGLPLLAPWVGVGWISDGLVESPEGAPPPEDAPYFSVMVGPRAYLSVIRATPPATLDFSNPIHHGQQLIPMAQLSGEVVIPARVGEFDAQVNLGSNLLTHLVELDAGYRGGGGAWSWRAGLTGGLVTGDWIIMLKDYSTGYPSTMTDFRVGLGFSADWERP